MALIKDLALRVVNRFRDPLDDSEDDEVTWEWLRSIVLPRGRRRMEVFFAWVAGLACLIALMHRFRYAADVTDEAFSIALPYRYVLGDKPFVDELSIQQTPGILTYPIVFAFVKLTGGSTGIVLFMRAIHLFLVKGVTALAVHTAASRWLKHRASAIAVAFLAFAFVPHSIPNVGYNVLAFCLLTAGTFLSAAAVSERKKGARFRLLFLAGLCHGLMAFAYPPMFPAPLLATALVFACVPDRRLAAVAAIVAGGAFAAAITLPSLGFGGIAGVRRSLGPWSDDPLLHPPSLHVRMKAIVEALWLDLPTAIPWAAGAIGLTWFLQSRPLVAVVVVGSVLAAIVTTREVVTGGTLVITVAFLTPFIILIAKPSREVWGGAVLIFLPSLVAAIFAATTSSQGPGGSAMGLHASMMLFAVLAVRALEQARADSMFCMFPPTALMFALVVHCYDFVYRDGAMPTLTETIKRGPFKGIRTTPDRAKTFAEYSALIDKYGDPRGRTLVLYENPGYYLFSKSAPGGHSVWETPRGDMDGMLNYWLKFANGHSVVIRIKGGGTGVLDPKLAPRDRLLEETPHFQVYRDQ